MAQGDFVVYILVSKKLELVYVVTFNSVLMLFDVITGSKMHQCQLSNSKVFEKVCSRDEESVIFIDRKGVVYKINIDKNNIVEYLNTANIPNSSDIIARLAEKTTLAGCKDIVMNKFNTLIASQMWAEAAEVAANSTDLRSKDTLNKFISNGNVQGQRNPVLY